jgi:uncharacterized protein
MQISLSGSTGFIGRELMEHFSGTKWTFSVINREDFTLDDETFITRKIEGADVVINLAGAPVSHRWSESYKNEIYHSRIDSTHKIVQCIIKSPTKPKVFISTSAIGIYDSLTEHTEESTGFSDDFLGKVCKEWETEAFTAQSVTRVIVIRTGVVLGTKGGALRNLHKVFQIGLGGIIGDGQQDFSWIHVRDLMKIYEFIIANETISGIVNGVAPYPTTNYHFTKTFGKVLTQPAIMKIPTFALKALYGEGAYSLMKGQKVVPEKLLKNGFVFEFSAIESALLNLYRI